MKKILLSIVFVLIVTMVNATNYYWVGGVGSSGTPKDWNSGSNWSLTTGGSAASAVPGSGDVAIFDGSTNNISPFVNIGGLSITIAGLQVYPLTTNNVVQFVNNSTSFTIAGDLTINKLSTTVYGQISDYGVNTFTVQGNINTNASGSYALVTIPATNSSLSAGKIAMTGATPIIQDVPTTAATVTATVSANKVTALTITNGGSGYLAAPTVAFSGGGGAGAAATLTLTNGVVTGYNISNGGTTNYTSTPTVTLSYGSNIGFQNLDISGSSNVTFNTGNALAINGNLNIQAGGKLTITRTLQFVSTIPTGSNPFNSPGTISGAGVIVGNTAWSLITQGTLPASYTTSNLQSIGTVNLDNTSATTSSINSLTQQRPNSTVTMGTVFLSSGIPTIAVGGGVTLSGGVLNDGGNTITVAGGTSISSTNTTLGAAVHTGTGRLKLIRTSANPLLVTAGKTVSVGNIEIGSTSSTGPYIVGAATNLTINGTLTISKATAGIINASGSTITFQNADVPVLLSAAGTITTDASTVLNFGSAGNTGGAAFTIPNSLFAAAPAIASFTVNRDNPLTFNNQALTVSGTTTITAGTLAMATTLTTTGGATVNGTFQLNEGGWATSGTWTYGAAGTLAFNKSSAAYTVNNTDVFWPTTSGPTNVSVLQGGLTLNSSSRTVSGLFQTASGVTQTNSTLTLNGTAQINAGGFFNESPTYGSSSTLIYNTTYGTSNEWTGGASSSVVAGSGIPANVTVQSGTVTLGGGRGIPGNLTVNSSNGLVLNATSGDLYLGGNLTHNGTTWTNNGRAVFFVGSGTQTVSASSGTQYFDYLILDKSAGSVQLSNSPATSVTINSTSGNVLQLNNTGSLDLNGQTLTLNNNGGTIKLNAGSRSINSTLANGTLAINGTKTVNNGGTLTTDANTTIAIAAGFDPGASLTSINGTLKINTSGYIANNSPAYGASSRLIYNNGGSYSTSLEWPSSNAPANVTVQSSGTSVTPNVNKTISGDLTVGSGAIMNIAAGKQLTISTSMTNNGTLNLRSTETDGTATILTPATISGGGTSTVEQFLTGGRNWYLSSPVTGANATTVLATSTASTKPSSFVWYDETKGSGVPTTPWTTEASTLTPMKGYIAVNDINTPSTDGTITFSGTLNTGDYSTDDANSLTLSATDVKDGFNLVGNPYPSYIDWNLAGKTNLNATMWYRTKEAGGYKFYTYNGTAAAYGGGEVGIPANVSSKIPPLQAFWVRAEGGHGILSFANSQRTHLSGTNPLKAPAAKQNVQQLIRLQVSNNTNNDEAVLYFNSNASNGYDAFDSPKMSNGSAAIPEIYTVAGTEQVAINGMNTLPLDTEIPLGFMTKTSNAFTLKASELTNLPEGVKVILKDNATEFDLTNGADYSFSSDVANSTGRFSIIFRSAGVATWLLDSYDANVLVYRTANNQIQVKINAEISANASVSVYNSVGQKLVNKRLTSNESIVDGISAAGIYVVAVTNNGKTTNRKVVIN